MNDICCIHNCLTVAEEGYIHCFRHLGIINQSLVREAKQAPATNGNLPDYSQKPSLAILYPKYYKAVPKGWEFLDTYAVNILFPVDDPSGCILHARKKLLVPGVRSGGKSMRKDISEARDTLNRWLELNPE